MKPRTLFEALPAVDGEKTYQGRSGRMAIGDLASVVEHHTMRTVSVSTENFGLLDCPKDQVLRRLQSPWFLKSIERLEASKGLKVEVSVTIYKLENVKHEAYRMNIQTMGAWTEDGQIWMLS